MKKLLTVFLMILLLTQCIPFTSVSAEVSLSVKTDTESVSDPISRGKMNTVTYVYWGKSELYAIMGMVGPNDEFDVYEYDKDWVMILYDTYISQGYTTYSHSFFGYVKRSEITCTPELEEGSSDKANTGPGKRKGKKPKTPKDTTKDETSDEPATAAPNTNEQTGGEPESTVPVNDDEEYDWIIRTQGTSRITVPYKEATFTCSFSLMAQKAGGLGPSSDPSFNNGMHTPYAATVLFSMVAPMQGMLDNMGTNIFMGSGGIEMTGQASSTFFLDTGSLDPALVNFSVTLQTSSTFNPQITDGKNITSTVPPTTINQDFPLPIQLKKSGKGYKFILKGMKPGGGDLEFPAVLEKTFSDPDRWDKAAKDADKKRKEAERLRKELLEKIKKQTQEEYKKAEEERNKNTNSNPQDGASNTDNSDPLDGASLTDDSNPLDGVSLTDDSGPLDGVSLTGDSEKSDESSSGGTDSDSAANWPEKDENAGDFPPRNP